MTDSCCDLKYDYVIKNNIPIVSLNVIIDKNEIKDDLGQSLGYKEFYNIIRNGEMPKTSQANAFYFEEEFEKIVKEGSSVIYIAFSSALSGTYNSACIAKESVLEKYPNADITIIDSKSASRGLGLLVYYANEMLKEGKSKEEIIWTFFHLCRRVYVIVGVNSFIKMGFMYLKMWSLYVCRSLISFLLCSHNWNPVLEHPVTPPRSLMLFYV